MILPPSPSFQRKSHHIIPLLGPELPMSARRNDNILLPLDRIAHRSSLPPGRQLEFPAHGPRLRVKSPEMTIDTSRYKDKIPGRDNSTAKIQRTPMLGFWK